jgi:coproporphyrinogen III oxidase-like Fe-S oxidoreductase
VIPDSLIGGIIGNVSRRYLSFRDTPTDVSLPIPADDKQYLLYLHIPFCVVLCPFCSFHRVEFKRDRTSHYFQQLRREIRLATDAGFRFNELYVGGGTPTVMPDELSKTIKMVRELHPVSNISAETNPDDLDDEKLPQIQEAGVSRLSVGVQSFDDELLREMQRYEKYGSGKQMIERLKRTQGKFDTLNIDMIFNFPHQTEESLHTDLDILTGELDAEQVSFYPLMTTNSTRKSMLRELGAVNYRREKQLYQLIVNHMLAAGYERSSAWCFSRKSGLIDEYITQQDEYLGLGSGAFSYLNGSIYSSTFSINHYLKLVEDGKTGIVRQRQIGHADRMRYALMMRLFGGTLDLQAAEEQFDGVFQRTLRSELTGLRLLGAITNDGRELRLTERGYYIWVMMMREFFTGVNQLREEMRHNIASEISVR